MEELRVFGSLIFMAEFPRPVWDGYFADPDVIRVGNTYYAYGTDAPEHPTVRQSSREVPCLRSKDLVDWEFMGGVLVPPPNLKGLDFWAPEVAEIKGSFHLYYSAGEPEGQGHKLRVAISDSPEGPFLDVEHIILPDEPFTIDAHPFIDPADGGLYLFFCMDFFDEPVGTGIAAVRMEEDGIRAAGPAVPVLRAQAEWQIYERNRFWYGQTWPKWHTVEGAFVVYREGRYWLFYSGGLWKGEKYGIGCAVADSVLGPYVDAKVEEGAGVLRSESPTPRPPPSLTSQSEGWGVLGPGHCSVVSNTRGNDYLAFHAWNAELTKRQMYIEPIVWTAEGPRIQRSSAAPR